MSMWFSVSKWFLFSGDYAFMGSLIIKEVVNELLTKGLDSAKVLLLAGSRCVCMCGLPLVRISNVWGWRLNFTRCFTSAGGTGVLVNVDHVSEQLASQGYRGVQVRGLADSGWFLDNKQYKFTDCLDTISCAPTEAIKRGIRWEAGSRVCTDVGAAFISCADLLTRGAFLLSRYWGGLMPESCRQAHVGEEWNCFFGYKVYPTLKSEYRHPPNFSTNLADI